MNAVMQFFSASRASFVRFSVLLLFIGLWFGVYSLLDAHVTYLQALVDNRTTLLTLISLFLIGPLWSAYGRLGSLDKLDGLPKNRRAQLAEFSSAARTDLLRMFFLCAVIVVVCYLALLIPSDLAHRNEIASAALALQFVLFPFLLLAIIQRFRLIDRTITSVNHWIAQETSRRKVIENLKKNRDAKSLDSDGSLARYRTVFEAIPDEKDAMNSQTDSTPATDRGA
jgi:hypothetical protein